MFTLLTFLLVPGYRNNFVDKIKDISIGAV